VAQLTLNNKSIVAGLRHLVVMSHERADNLQRLHITDGMSTKVCGKIIVLYANTTNDVF
jgi:hypothetical protein